MRSYPSDKDDRKYLKRLNAEPWMVEALRMNPSYTCWGPHEDYMCDGGQWSKPVLIEAWKDFGPWTLDDYNEVVHFYFMVERSSKNCEACDQTGYNPATKAISDGFYAHSSPTGIGWNDKITQDEVEALQEAGRLRKWINGKWQRVPLTADDVNAANRPGPIMGDMRHDGINRGILIETRAKRLGVYGECPACGGHGYVFTAPAAKLGLVLWVLHPRKGCSQGVEIKTVTKDDLPAACKYLRDAAARNADRFSRVLAAPV